MDKQKLKDIIVLCGISHSGKSTLARKLYTDFPDLDYQIVNTDVIREALHGNRTIYQEDETQVWDLWNKSRQGAILNGRNIILDACHVSSQARWHALQDIDGYRSACVVLETSWPTLMKYWIAGGKRVELEYVKDMFRNCYPLPTKLMLMKEGFKKVWTYGYQKGN